MKSAILTLCALLLFGGAQDEKKPDKPDLSTPEAAIHTFVAALNDHDLNRVAACVVGGKPHPAFQELGREGRKNADKFVLSELKVQANGDNADATMKVSIESPLDPPGVKDVPIKDKLQLRRARGDWKIVPGPPGAIVPRPGGYLRSFATLALYPDTMIQAHNASQSVACFNNIKQVVLGARMFLQDHKDKFALKADSYKKSLMPYIQNEKVFHCPTDKSGAVDYAFNRYLEGIPMAAVHEPAKTVMIYEGKKGVLDFRHSGGAYVGFADGHCKLVDAREALILRWKP